MQSAIPCIVKGFGFSHLFLQRSFIQSALALLDALSDDAGQPLLKLEVVVEVVFIKSLEYRHIGVVRGLLQVFSPGEIVVQIDLCIQSLGAERYSEPNEEVN